MNMNNNKWPMVTILCIAIVATFYNLHDLMSFFGDQAWFYLSARDMLLTWNVPLVGIASSHPWLHQGAYWTYILSAIFAVTNFSPYVPAYITATVSIITVWLLYVVGKKMFSSIVGLFAAFLYATSPLIIINARMPYHTSLIPFLVLVYVYALYKWLQGNIRYFPLLVGLVALLYNFEIATTPFTVILILCLLYGFWKKSDFAIKLISKKSISSSLIVWFLVMLPMLLYDIQNGFPQTVKFVLWIGYRVARLFGYPDIHRDTIFTPLAPFLPFTITKMHDLLFELNNVIAAIILLTAFAAVSYKIYLHWKTKHKDIALVSLYVSFTIPFMGYLGLHTSSDAYWPMFFPTIMLLVGYGFGLLMWKNKFLSAGVCIAVLFVGFSNGFLLLSNNYFMSAESYGYPMSERVQVAETIVKEAKGEKYTIIGKGKGSEFASFTMPYEYLAWWLNKKNIPSKSAKIKTFIVSETNRGIIIKEK